MSRKIEVPATLFLRMAELIEGYSRDRLAANPIEEEAAPYIRAAHTAEQEPDAISWTKIRSNGSGHPRYVCHFLNLNSRQELSAQTDIGVKYQQALARASKLGGRKFSNKQYGGGIVFTTFDLGETEVKIRKAVLS